MGFNLHVPLPGPISYNKRLGGNQGCGCGTVLGLTFTIYLVSKYWWVVASVVVVLVVVWAAPRITRRRQVAQAEAATVPLPVVRGRRGRSAR
jgi:uncharacterized membrane protein